MRQPPDKNSVLERVQEDANPTPVNESFCEQGWSWKFAMTKLTKEFTSSPSYKGSKSRTRCSRLGRKGDVKELRLSADVHDSDEEGYKGTTSRSRC
uniref:Uncharacterized protein n=1 Tax=Trichuris muris TaxID=70415 RepID=A0A5S6QM32_TRIMR